MSNEENDKGSGLGIDELDDASGGGIQGGKPTYQKPSMIVDKQIGDGGNQPQLTVFECVSLCSGMTPEPELPEI